MIATKDKGKAAMKRKMKQTKSGKPDPQPEDYSKDVVAVEEPEIVATESSDHPKLYTRTTPAAFHDALARLNKVQKAAVRDMGFGHILNLKVKDIPSQMAYWVVDNFDGRSGEVQFKDNMRLKVTEDDVYRVFGFPKGTAKIESFRKSSNNDLMDQWVNLFGVDDREKIKITLLLDYMVDGVDGGTWFRRNFLISMAFCLIESRSNGMVHPYILRCLEDIRSVKKWNWGDYVLRTLVEQKRKWLKNGRTTFSGPPLFLILYYVDRFEVNMVKEPRLFPILVNWNSKDLRRRQKSETDDGYFGGGALLDPIKLPHEYDDVVANTFGYAEGESSFTGARHLRLTRQALEIAQGVERLKDILAGASTAERESEIFKETVVSVSKISGVELDINYKGTAEHQTDRGKGRCLYQTELRDKGDTRNAVSPREVSDQEMESIEVTNSVAAQPILSHRVENRSVLDAGLQSVDKQTTIDETVHEVAEKTGDEVDTVNDAVTKIPGRDKGKGKIVSEKTKAAPVMGWRKSDRVKVKGIVINDSEQKLGDDAPMVVKNTYVRKSK